MDQTVTLTLTIQQLNVILAGIAKLPIEIGMETFNGVQQQAHAQLGQSNSVKNTLADKIIK